MLGGLAAVHLDELGTVPVAPVERGVQGGHEGALARPQDGVDARAAVQQQLAGVQVTVQRRHVEGRLPVLGGYVQQTRPALDQPLDQLQTTRGYGLVSNSGAPDGPGVQGASVLRQDLQGLQLALCRRAQRGSVDF